MGVRRAACLFIDTVCEGYKKALVGFTFLFTRFENQNYCHLLQRGADDIRLPDVIKEVKQKSQYRFGEIFQELE